MEKTIRTGNLDITFRHNKKDRLFGRFGGGWNWALGIQVGTRTIIINLLIMSIRIEKDDPLP